MLTAYLGWKLVKKTKIVSLDEVPLKDALARAEEYDPEVAPKQKGWTRAVSWIWD